MKDIDLRSLTHEELNHLLNDIGDELERREHKEKEELCNKFAMVVQEIYDAGYSIWVNGEMVGSTGLYTDNFNIIKE